MWEDIYRNIDSNRRYTDNDIIIGNGGTNDMKHIDREPVVARLMKDNSSGTVEETDKKIRFGSVDIIDICPPCVPVSTSNRYHVLNESEENDEIHMMGLDRVEPVHDPRVDIHVVTKHHRTYDKSGKYIRLTCTSDSGAGESVLPKTWFPEIASEMSDECNTSYASADGTLLANEGMKVLSGYTMDGKKIKMNWQLTDVTKPLASVGRLTERGHRVVFDDSEPGGGFILHKASGVRTPVRKTRGVYEFDVWVKVPETTSKSQQSSGNGGSQRQG
jgi:hypothetical protein